MSSDRLRYLEQCRQQFDDLPPEVIVKEDMLRLGVSLGNTWESASNEADNYQKKSYFIFSFDRTPIREMAESENLRAPEEIALIGGPQNFRRTIVSVRLNPTSPYQLNKDESGYLIKLDGEVLCRAKLPPKPSYYGRSLAGGKPITEIAPCIEWGYLIYLTVFRRCQYIGGDQECRFCDINANFDQQRDAGLPYTTVKSVDEILDALEIIAASDHRSQAYTLTGGSVTSTLRGKTEADFYLEYAEAIEKRFPHKWIGKIVVQALPTEDLIKFRDAGIRIYHPNYEVWDKRLFELLCPGKNQYIGRQLWIDRILDAAKVFGPSCVIPNFVAGIEMSRPYGFETVEEAIRSTAEGLDFFMSHGITPRFTTWCPEPLSNLGSQEPAPLEYHLSLLQIYRDTMQRHRLSSPPGYGPPGIGNAIFSVSSFMDVLPPATESLVHSA
ncbi:MAG: radical SAM protein [Acidobacteria bacterium RIFCSPLOWO2_12_FULL_54_10]|nr:MAG: radical SAM protein [Acidobacteria bacterium RIFCSPLOWO2_12_FULL_54_10]